MIICDDYDDAKFTAISLIADWDNHIKELSITYNKEDKTFNVDYEEFSENEYEEIFNE